MTTRKELVEALRARYRGASVADKVKILDEFVALTGYHRKHAIRTLREEATPKEARARNRLYDQATRQALTVLWEAADRVCGKRSDRLARSVKDKLEQQQPACASRQRCPHTARSALREQASLKTLSIVRQTGTRAAGNRHGREAGRCLDFGSSGHRRGGPSPRPWTCSRTGCPRGYAR